MKLIKTIDNLDASVNIPGSKSVTHRYLIMAALAEGRSWLGNGLWCDDTRYTASALKSFGAQIRHSSEAIEVIGMGGDLSCPAEPIYLENAGTSLRLLTAVACLGQGSSILVGNERMHTRPIEELSAALQPLGGVVESLQERGYPPVRIHGSGLKGGSTIVDASRSSQFVSAILLVAPYASQPVEITVQGLVSKPYVDVTLDGMSRFGARARWLDEKTLRVEAPGRYLAGSYDVEGDCSSASYFWAAAAITGGRVSTQNIHRESRQGDLAFLKILCQMGCRAEWHDHGVTLYGGKLRAIEVDMKDMPDMVPTLAVTAAFAQGKTVITNVGHLRIKESDRLRAIAEGLEKMNIQVDEKEDRLTIRGGNPRGAMITSHHDHRIAMSFAVAGLLAEGVRIDDEMCVSKSFPQFWETFEQLYR
ncbi:MAG: 3-phosphoshikimate 1-carboxyvinyltransferase [Deltaproteobacteria bacterium]|nr:3-phosphoshikimate 1-carboxyvinyltransferase [Deltaproteobacteria bacterium]